MSSLPPNHVYRATLSRVREAGKATSTDPLTNAVERFLLGDRRVPSEVAYAFDIYGDNYQREVIEAFLLAGADPDDVTHILGVPADITTVYATLFFDVASFRNRLEIESYVRTYPRDQGNGYGYRIKTDALEHGLEYLKVTFGRGSYQVNPESALNEAISQSYLLMKQASRHPIDSAKTKEARQWMTSMVSTMQATPDILSGRNRNSEGLLIRLRLVEYDQIAPTVTPDELISRATARPKED